jgi:hypothetical protein
MRLDKESREHQEADFKRHALQQSQQQQGMVQAQGRVSSAGQMQIPVSTA